MKVKYEKSQIIRLTLVYILSIVALNLSFFPLMKSLPEIEIYFILLFEILIFAFIFVIEIIAIGFVDAQIYKAKNEIKVYPEEYNMIYNELKNKKLIEVEKIRKTAKAFDSWVAILGILAFFSLMIASELALNFSNMTVYRILAFMFICIVACVILSNRAKAYKNKYIVEFKKHVIPEFINLIDSDFKFIISDNERIEYYDSLYSESTFSSLSGYEHIHCEDYIEGIMDEKTKANIVDFYIESSNNGKRHVEYKGLFATFDSPYISKDIDFRLRKFTTYKEHRLSKVKTGYVKMDKLYNVYTDNGAMIDRIIKRGFFDELTIRFINENLYPEIIVKNGKIFVRYEMSGAFEPRLSDKTNGYETLYKYYLALKCLSDSYYLVLKYFQNE